MSELTLPIRVPHSAYPERLQSPSGWLDQAANRAVSPFLRWRQTFWLRHGRFIKAVASAAPWAAALRDDQIREAAATLGRELRQRRFPLELAARCFSLTREVAGRTLGQRHFDVQLVGGRALLQGMVAEMETGEGKTLTATLAAVAAALAGFPVHIITVNDYLANRDAEWMGPIYRMLGLDVGVVVHGLTMDQRREAYGADVTYCTNKELAFDYLKDRITLGNETARTKLQMERLYEERPRLRQLLLRGLFFGIVDEADSVLIDEARTPLIISGGKNSDSMQREIYQSALSLASGMEEGVDFALEGRERSVRLLPAGLEQLEQMARSLGGVWARRSWRDELLRQALVAQHLFLNGKQYLVNNGKVQIIDEYTGRLMADRSWEHGLHQMIEVKEGCDLSRRTDPLARISYQKLFRRYLRLAGMTGTAREVAGELWSVYRLATVRVPTNRPARRRRLPGQVYASRSERWSAVVRRIEEIHAAGRPVLVGTRSVEASETLSQLLQARGMDHALLNARQDAEEARIVAQAGRSGRITVATNMAGRGTDIQLGQGVAALGGLHVIATELHEARRIDRQLFGRCARQGDPGSCEVIASLEDELARVYSPRWMKRLAQAGTNSARGVFLLASALSLRIAQRSAERLHRRLRRDLLKLDEQLDSTLAFSGGSE
jgi:preprotein translocase subunit SecA